MSFTAAEFQKSSFKGNAPKSSRKSNAAVHLYFGKRAPIDVAGRTVILVDDGIATGATARVAILGLQQRRPRKVILAVPVGAAETMEALRHEVEEVVCLEEPAALGAIGFHYGDFPQLSDEEVMEALASTRSR